MRAYTVKGEQHTVYDLESETPNGMVINPTWKKSRVGDWVRADDNAIIQVLEVKKIGETTVVVTCIGTYSTAGTMDTSERANRYTLNGKRCSETLRTRKKPTQREILFAKRIALGERPVDAYLAVYDAKSRNYASKRAAILLKTERVDKLMNKDLEDVFAKKGIDLDYLIGQAKDECDNSKNGSERLNALKMLWEAYGVVEKRKVTEITGIFQGFEPKKIEEVKRPELPEYQSLGDETL